MNQRGAQSRVQSSSRYVPRASAVGCLLRAKLGVMCSSRPPRNVNVLAAGFSGSPSVIGIAFGHYVLSGLVERHAPPLRGVIGRQLVRITTDALLMIAFPSAAKWVLNQSLMALVRYVAEVLEPAFVETDGRGRVLLPGHPNQRYLVQENADGSILLQPATVMSEAQHEVESTPELRDLLARAAAAPTVSRTRQRRS